MKKIYLSILAATLFMSACNNAPEGEAVAVEEQKTVETNVAPEGEPYAVSSTSSIGFEGASPTHSQTGSFPVSEGTLYVKDNVVTGGKVKVDLNRMSITSEGLESEKKDKLKNHLLGEDFFNVTANPTVNFEITKIEAAANNEGFYNVTGNLSMNGKTNSISFPARITNEDAGIHATADFVINRKDWGMSYKNDESLGDDWIYDKVKMILDIKASK